MVVFNWVSYHIIIMDSSVQLIYGFLPYMGSSVQLGFLPYMGSSVQLGFLPYMGSSVQLGFLPYMGSRVSYHIILVFKELSESSIAKHLAV